MSTRLEDQRAGDLEDQINEAGLDANKNKRTIPSSMYKRTDREKTKKVLFSCYIAMVFLSIGLCVASFSFPTLQKTRLKGIAMWQWCLLISALLCGPLLSQAIVQFILLFIDREFSVRENVIYYVVGLIDSAWVVLWFSIILVAWLWVVDEPRYLGMPRHDTIKIKQMYGMTFHIITVTLITLILGSFLWMLKDLLIMKAKSEFHIRRFFDRIKKALFHMYVIDQLLVKSSKGDVKRSIKKDFSLEFRSSDDKAFRKGGLLRCKGKKEVHLSDFESVSQEEVSCWWMKILIRAITDCRYLTYKTRDYANGNSERPREIDSEGKAAKLGDDIFSFVLDGGAADNCIQEKELSEYFGDNDKVNKVRQCLLEGADDDEIGKEVLKKWMVKVYKHREALVRTLDANKDIFRTFNRFVNVLLVFLIFCLWLIMLRVETRKVIFFIASGLVSSAFLFGETCKKLLDNILFVFWVHPYDIGDCCLIDNTPVIIEEIHMLTTTVLTFDNEKKHYPNASLSTQSITNYTRSPLVGDIVALSLDISTTVEDIDKLKSGIKSYIEDRPRCWSSKHHWVMELLDENDNSKIKMTLHIQHTNYDEFIDRQLRKSDLVLEIKKILDNLKKQETNNNKVLIPIN